MDAWKLPTSIDVCGKEYSIRTDFRVVLDVLTAMNDPKILSPDMTEDEKQWEKILTMLQILYVDFEDMPPKDWKEAAEKAVDFIDCGIKPGDSPKPRLMDWEHDAPVVIPAINKVAHKDVRSEEYMHWWTFFGLYMEVGESTFSTIVSIREKKRKGKKLEKWEKDFCRDNQKLVDFEKKQKVERSKEEREALDLLFGKI